ncbi:hypothetical protein J7F01_14740 [Streptomyces sp. ISL-22]|uniref:hypothetical protein n=1 Tax=unclassified Streptomyces TaxID=2593676 RepID=UPI001BEB5601|nr:MULTISPECIES: hypothetical protein [unclassified Streptomyces]MBT2421882.1 hypothetical protein [Streptomyces sp. ISL-24]MBT2433432.1 hypothetical protein [Streptomyces sp. ISL-22]
MDPSPRRRRGKPRHARPRPARTRVCEPCLSGCLELALGQAGQVLFLQPHGHWLSTAGFLVLLGLRLTRHRDGHGLLDQPH